MIFLATVMVYGLDDLTDSKAINDNINKLNYNIFKYNSGKYIQDSDSDFNQHRLAVIRSCIETNLKAAISNYSAGYTMPKISETDWDLLINNVCLISFLQGMSIGGKVYNGYAVVKNTLNKEVVAIDSIYILAVDSGNVNNGKYYRVTSNALQSASNMTLGVLNLDFERHVITNSDNSNTFFYPKSPSNANPTNKNIYYADYGSVVSQTDVITSYSDIYKYMRNNSNNTLKKLYYTALGRERYSSYKVNNDNILS